MAQLYFRHGTMASGKSIEVLKIAYSYEEAKKQVLLFTSALDTRSGPCMISSRIGAKRSAISIAADTDIFSICKNQPVDCILVDESQFLQRAQVRQLVDVVDTLHIPVICYGLKNDFRNQLFPGSEALLIYADKIEEVKSVCRFCNRKATMHLRIAGGVPVREGDQILIGGDESYHAVCRHHWHTPPTA